MVRRDAGFLKKERLKDITVFMAQAIKGGINLPSLLDWIEMEVGLTRQTAKSYVELIMRRQNWYYDEEVIKAYVEGEV